jgi:hypothetical protein
MYILAQTETIFFRGYWKSYSVHTVFLLVQCIQMESYHIKSMGAVMLCYDNMCYFESFHRLRFLFINVKLSSQIGFSLSIWISSISSGKIHILYMDESWGHNLIPQVSTWTINPVKNNDHMFWISILMIFKPGMKRESTCIVGKTVAFPKGTFYFRITSLNSDPLYMPRVQL